MLRVTFTTIFKTFSEQSDKDIFQFHLMQQRQGTKFTKYILFQYRKQAIFF